MVKTDAEITHLREGGKRLAHILAAVGEAARPGVTTHDLDALAEKLVRQGGDTPSLKGYHPEFAKRPYPATLCVSVNEEVVHGIPGERVLKEGDIVGLDLVITHHGLFVDAALTVGVGKVDRKATQLMQATKEGLAAGILAARAGNRMNDIGRAVEKVGNSYGYGVVWELGGHGVGHQVHEEPYVPNVEFKDEGAELVPGMVIAIEPMFTEGTPEVKLLRDGYTFVTADGSRAAHFEHSILITKNDPEILTKV